MKLSLTICLITITLNFGFSQNCDYDTFYTKLESANTQKDSMSIILNHLKCASDRQGNLLKSFGALNKTSSYNNEYVVKEKKDFAKKYKEKQNSLKQNLLNVTDVFEEINDNAFAIKDRLIQHDLENYIKQIYNPESKLTGTKFSDILNKQLMEDVIKHLNLGNKEPKILSIIESITKSPLLQAIPPFESAIKVTTDIISFIRNFLFKNDIDKLKLLQNFEKNMSRYLIFYGELEKSNLSYGYKLNEVKARINVLYSNYHEYLLKTSKTAGFNDYVYDKNIELKKTNDDLIFNFNKFLKNRVNNNFSNTDFYDDLKNNCISVIIHNPVILAITSLSKIRSPKYLRLSL